MPTTTAVRVLTHCRYIYLNCKGWVNTPHFFRTRIAASVLTQGCVNTLATFVGPYSCSQMLTYHGYKLWGSVNANDPIDCPILLNERIHRQRPDLIIHGHELEVRVTCGQFTQHHTFNPCMLI